ncbi:mechanosensitive ion channel family protein [Vibrio barjaei]|uniref:mechanosensitive ion channel family protein n=1 Tax=Vibrio barjaei TaxID=1676683 RepID=UPI00228411C6|nr:mechanosensitive ion channel family protein [Vibrio barjaei]MCY9873822.1 mechanosensitive ion channel family protein [Vibrio barjaei]
MTFDHFFEVGKAVSLALLYVSFWLFVYTRVSKYLKTTEKEHWRLTFKALRFPVAIAICSFPLSTLIEWAFSKSGYQEIYGVSVSIFFVLLTGWFAHNVISLIEDRFFNDDKVDAMLVSAIGKVAKLLLATVVIFSILTKLNVNFGALLTFGGVSGLVVGLASKDLLINFFGGMVLYFDQSFKVGEWVRSPDREIEGVIESLGWRVTSIRTFDKRILYVPNSVWMNVVIENASRMQNRRIYEYFRVEATDADNIGLLMTDIKHMLYEHPGIDSNPNLTTIVTIDSVDESGINFFVYCFTHTISWVRFHEVKQEVILSILKKMEERDIRVAADKVSVIPRQKSGSSQSMIETVS